MPLRIELAPHERLIIGEASIRNGPRRSEFVIETQTKVLRERDIITESEADTPCKRLYLALEAAYLSADPAPLEARFMALANEVMAAAPSTAPFIADAFECILAGDYYKALKSAKKLLAFEAELLALARSNALRDAEAGAA
jgi:flagellar protein FlbT